MTIAVLSAVALGFAAGLLARLLGTSALVYLGGRMALRLDLAAAVVFGGEILLTLARPHEFERFTSVNRKK